MTKLKLEAGKYYRTKKMQKAKLLEKMGDKWIGAVQWFDDTWEAFEWDLTEAGEYIPEGGEYGYDLIAEWNDDDDYEEVDLTKITLDMLPLEARFRNSRDKPWFHSELFGYRPDTNYYLCAGYEWWRFCQVRKSQP